MEPDEKFLEVGSLVDSGRPTWSSWTGLPDVKRLKIAESVSFASLIAVSKNVSDSSCAYIIFVSRRAPRVAKAIITVIHKTAENLFSEFPVFIEKKKGNLDLNISNL